MNFRSIIIGLSFCLPLLFHPVANAGEYLSVKNDGVNIRSGPSTSEEVLWEVFQGYPLEILKRKDTWAQCQDFEGDRGWIYTNLLSSEKKVIVRKNMVNMRAGAGKNYESIATIKYGVIFTPLEKEGDWLKVKHEDGTEGWIFKSLVWPSDPL